MIKIKYKNASIDFSDEEIISLFEKSPEAQDEAIREKIKVAEKDNLKLNSLSEIRVSGSLLNDKTQSKNANMNNNLKYERLTYLDLATSKIKSSLLNSPAVKQRVQNKINQEKSKEVAEAHKTLKFKLKFSPSFISNFAGGEVNDNKIQAIKKEIKKQLLPQGITEQDMLFRVPKSFNFGGQSYQNNKNENYLDSLARALATNFSSMSKSSIENDMKLKNDPNPTSKNGEGVRKLDEGQPTDAEKAKQQGAAQKPITKEQQKENEEIKEDGKNKKVNDAEKDAVRTATIQNFKLDDLGETVINNILNKPENQRYPTLEKAIYQQFVSKDKIYLNDTELKNITSSAEVDLKEKGRERDESCRIKFNAMDIQNELDLEFKKTEKRLQFMGPSERKAEIRKMVKRVFEQQNLFTEEEIENFRPSNNNIEITIGSKRVNVKNMRGLNIVEFFTVFYTNKYEVLNGKKDMKDAYKDMQGQLGIEVNSMNELAALLGISQKEIEKRKAEDAALDRSILEQMASFGPTRPII